jgi:hypothetical protein
MFATMFATMSAMVLAIKQDDAVTRPQPQYPPYLMRQIRVIYREGESRGSCIMEVVRDIRNSLWRDKKSVGVW